MSQSFDPYYHWLSIPPKDQPPHHYRLLGLDLFENERDVIAAAANRVMTYLKELAPGDDSGQSQRLLNEVAKARVCLLTRDKKLAYDRQLRSQLTPPQSPPLVAPQPIEGLMADLASPPRPVTGASPAGPDGALSVSALPRIRTDRPAKRRVLRPLYPLIVMSSAGLVLVATGMSLWYAAKGDLVVRSQERRVEGMTPDGNEVVGNQRQPDVAPEPPGGDPLVGDSAGFDHDQNNRESPKFSQPQPGMIQDGLDDEHRGDDGGRGRQATGDELRELFPENFPSDRPAAMPADEEPLDGYREPPEMPVPPAVQPEEAKLAVPDPAARNAARRKIQDAYREKLPAAKTFLEKSDLAEEFLTLAIETKDDSASRYVLFEDAVELAAQAPHFDTAMRAIEEWGKHFEVNVWALKKDALKEIGAQAKCPQNARQFAEAVLAIIEAAEAAEKWDEGLEIHKVADNAAVRSQDSELRAQLRRCGERLEAARKLSKPAELARQRLQTEPDNPSANATLGKYLCLIRQQWEKGLPYLIKGDDVRPALKQAAEKDLHSPADASGRSAVADLWWEAAYTARGLERQSLLARAGHWYHQALDGMSGLTRIRLEKRMEEVEKEVPGWNSEATGHGMTSSESFPRSLADLLSP